MRSEVQECGYHGGVGVYGAANTGYLGIVTVLAPSTDRYNVSIDTLQNTSSQATLKLKIKIAIQLLNFYHFNVNQVPNTSNI